MTSVMALDSVTSFSPLKDVTNTSKHSYTVQLLARILQWNGGKLEEAENWKKLKTSNVFSSCVRIKIDQL